MPTNMESFAQRAYLLSSLVRLGIHVSSHVYRFCDEVIETGWIAPHDNRDCDQQVLEMYSHYNSGVRV